jgi:probable F420-dependent oxidoreductase
VKFSISIPLAQCNPPDEFQTPEAVREIAAALERSGATAGNLTDHPAPSADWLNTHYTGHDTLDPFTGLAFIASQTRRLMLHTSVLILPYRNPFLTAKAAATFQVLSGGRLILGVGAGYQKLEFEALGVSFAERSALMDEALETIRLAWAGGRVVKQGRYFNALGNEIRPVASPPPPIWVGGNSLRAMERAARYGDGWSPFLTHLDRDSFEGDQSSINSIAQLARMIGRLKERRDELGQSPNMDIAVATRSMPKANAPGEAQRYCEIVEKLRSVGVTWIFDILPAPSRAAYLENLAWFSENVITNLNR